LIHSISVLLYFCVDDVDGVLGVGEAVTGGAMVGEAEGCLVASSGDGRTCDTSQRPARAVKVSGYCSVTIC
jgi:hypothetical protein